MSSTPNVTTTFVDAERKITFHIIAYRTLSQDEAIQSIRLFLSQNKKPLKSGQVVKIETIIGHGA